MYQNPKTQIEIVMFPMARSLTKEKFNEIINNKDYDFATCFIRRKLMILLCLKYNKVDSYKTLFVKYQHEIKDDEVIKLFKTIEENYEGINNHTSHTNLNLQQLIFLYNHVSSLEQDLIDKKRLCLK